MFKSVLLPLAQKDIREAAKWYNEKSAGLGKKFTTEVREKVRFIECNPYATSIRYSNIRTTVLSIFPYMIHYSVDETNKIIVISAVFHTSHDPEQWSAR
jgi:plasmid stabilization system protein ParE